MKLQTTAHAPVESQGVSEQGSFSIKTSSHAFRLLSSGLYTNKIQAVIRELSCNAADAHVMNGNQKTPFDIKIPNALDGQFYVRDYGPGMSDDNVMRLYTTYFESTKQNSNDFTGGFGVGSKSPFAYTDMFTVVSIHEGMKATYSAYVDDGEPKIVRLGDAQETTEPAGLSVGFPVKPEDARSFHEEASNVLAWFRSPVNILGLADSQKPVPFDSKGVIIKSPNVLMFGSKYNDSVQLSSPPGSHHSSSNRHREGNMLGTVVMGNVHYPLPLDESLKNLPEAKWFAARNAVFTVPIGSVSVAASREALAFDRFTKEAAKNIVQTAFSDVAKELWKYIEKKAKAANGTNDLRGHLAARQILNAFGFSEPDMATIFMKAIDATPEQKKLFEPRSLVDPKNIPKTFTLFLLERTNMFGHDQVYKAGAPFNWTPLSAAKGTATDVLDMNGSYDFVENGARMHGPRVDKAITDVIAGMKDTASSHRRSFYMIVPNEKAKPADYEREKLAWKEYLGVESAQFSKMGDTFKNEGVAAFDPYNYNTQTLELLPTTPPFFYMSETEFKSIGGSLKKDRHNYYLTVSARNVHSLQKNLGMKTPIEHMYVVADADADRVKKVCPNAYSFIEDFCIKTLLAPKVQKKIGNIKPMMSNASSTFSSIRGLVKRDPQWADTLKDSKIGEWFDHMRSVKGSMSYDYTTMQVLKNLKTALGEDVFPSIVPEFYDGNDVESTISTRYPFLQTHTYSRFALSVAQLQHLKAYVQWCEDNGASPPGQAKVSAIDDNAPAGP